ncbi:MULTISPECIES: hypothetical protein [unclassified Nonomuraea]|uniref:hypothetical protein n=1 Tax=unclassified Nonomuraea TaxID=2593643 RepID=UPI0033D9AB79
MGVRLQRLRKLAPSEDCYLSELRTPGLTAKEKRRRCQLGNCSDHRLVRAADLRRDPALSQAIAVLARAQQDAVWNRQQLANQLRSLLREYFPAALKAFHVKNIGLTP